MIDAVMLFLSWTMFAPPAHDLDVRAMPDMSTCLQRARVITEKIADLEQRGSRAKLIAPCVFMPTNLPT
ncbi:MAG: hypothetical protein ACRBM6_16340 [Geminicoccales bacterium]